MRLTSLARLAVPAPRTTPLLETVVYESAADFAAWWAARRPAARFLPFQDPRVMAVWERTIGAGMDARCRVARLDVDGRPLLAAFFALTPMGRKGLTQLSFMDGGVTDYNAPILFEPLRDCDLPANVLWCHLRRILKPHDRLQLTKIPARVQGSANPLWPPPQGADHRTAGHVMTLPQDWKSVLEEKGHHRIVKAATRNLRQLGARGSLRLVIASGDGDHTRLLDALIADKRAQFARMGVSDLFVQPGVESFYRQCVAIQDPPITHLSALQLDEEILATNMGFVDCERFCGVLTAFKQGPWARHSCGHLHLQLLLRWAVQNKLKYFDFGIGDEEYKKFWCDQDVALRDLSGPASAAGHAHNLFYSMRGKARAMLRRYCS